MTTELALRPATINDYDAVALIFDEIERLHRHALPYTFRAVDGRALDHAFFEAAIDDPDADWLLAEQAGDILGFANVHVLQVSDRPMLLPRRYVEVDSLAVRAAHQHTGIGRALMQRVEVWAAERGLHEIQLNVWEFNQRALGFYEQLGYVTERRTLRRVIRDVNS